MAAPNISERSLKKIVGFVGVIVEVYRSMFLAFGARRNRLYCGHSRNQRSQELRSDDIAHALLRALPIVGAGGQTGFALSGQSVRLLAAVTRGAVPNQCLFFQGAQQVQDGGEICVQGIAQLAGGSFGPLVKQNHDVQASAGNVLIREHGVVDRDDVPSQKCGAKPITFR